MAQRQVGATEFAQGGSDPLAHSNLHNQSVHLDGNTMVGHPGSSTAGESDTHNVTSTMSQSHTLTPSRGGTLKKRQSLSRKNSLKRTGSRKDSRPASVKSLTFADDVGGYGSEMTSAFFTPVPTTGSPTEILANRFQVWRKVLKDLITYFRDIQKSYDARSKSLYTISNVITNIPTPPHFVSEGGISDAIYVLRDFHKQSITEGNKAKSIEEEVIVQLTGLRSDLGQKIKEIKGLSGDFKNGVDKETEGTRRAVRDLQDALGAANTDAKNDPYLIRLGVDRQLGRQIEEENYLHRAFLNLESSGRELESIVMGEIQKAYSAYAGIIKREADEAYETVERLRSGPLAIPKDFEWNAFVDNNEHFVDPRLPVRRVENITYPGKDDAAASEVKAGMLERKSKYLKSYTPGWYVLSTTHIHEFKSPDRISSQAPVMSLPLADQKLGSHSNADSTSHKFMLKGRQSGGMHRGHAWVFRAESFDTMLAWFSDIKSLTEKTGAERKEFIRRSHARSVSAGSHKAGSISSDGGMDEDEADEVPYSATASQAEIPPQVEKLPQRPNPGGRFPSALKINRDSQVPVSPSSPSSSTGDREIIAAASALPESGVPFGSSGRKVQVGYDETNPARGELDGASATPLAMDSYSPMASKEGLKGLPLQKGSNSATIAGVKDHNSPEQAQSIGSSDDPGSVTYHHQQVEPTPRSLPFNVERHDSKYGDWLAGAGGAAVGAAGIEAYRHDGKEIEPAAHEDQPGLQTAPAATQVSAPAPQESGQPPVQGAIFAAFPFASSSTNDTANQSISPTIGDPTSHASDPASPIKDLASRPSLGSRVATISELHVPGEFPKGNPPMNSS